MQTTVTLLGMLLAASSSAYSQDRTSDADAGPLRRVLADYNRGLNNCDVEALLKVWEPDGVFMAPNQPAAEGTRQLRASYQDYCARTKADLTFTPTEVQQAGDWGWLRVAATGTLRNLRAGVVTRQDNKSLIVVHRGADGTWRMARYAINSNTPAAPPPCAD